VSSYQAVVNPEELIARYQVPGDPEKAWKMVQIAATLRLVRFALGDAWYNIVLKHAEADNALPDAERRQFRRLAKADPSRVHPLADTFWAGGPADHLHLVRFGGALRTLLFESGDTNWKVKADELASVQFAHAYFELRIASIYARNGFSVRFIPLVPGVQSPDLQLRRDGSSAVLECKKRVSTLADPVDRRVRGVVDRLRDARQQIAAAQQPGIAYIEIEAELPPADLELYTAAVAPLLVDLPEVCCAILTWEEVREHGEYFSVANGVRAFPNSHARCPFPVAWCNPANLGAVAPSYPVDHGPAPPHGERRQN